jgi:hypothetical protein
MKQVRPLSSLGLLSPSACEGRGREPVTSAVGRVRWVRPLPHLTPTLSATKNREGEFGHWRGRVRAFCAIAFILPPMLAGCGKRGEPIPPPDAPVTYPRPYPSV